MMKHLFISLLFVAPLAIAQGPDKPNSDSAPWVQRAAQLHQRAQDVLGSWDQDQEYQQRTEHYQKRRDAFGQKDQRRPILVKGMADIYKDPMNGPAMVDGLGVHPNTLIPKAIVGFGETGIFGHTTWSVLNSAARGGGCKLEHIKLLLARGGNPDKRPEHPAHKRLDPKEVTKNTFPGVWTPRELTKNIRAQAYGKYGQKPNENCCACARDVMRLFDEFAARESSKK